MWLEYALYTLLVETIPLLNLQKTKTCPNYNITILLDGLYFFCSKLPNIPEKL